MDLKPLYFIMYAKFDGNCEETGKAIKSGDIVTYLKPVKGVCGGRIFCKESKLFKEASKNVRTSWNIKVEDQ